MEISQHRRRRLRRWGKKKHGKITRGGRRPAYCYSCVIKNEKGARCWGSTVSWRGCPSVAFRLTSLPRRAQWRTGRGEGGSQEEEKTPSSNHKFWAEVTNTVIFKRSVRLCSPACPPLHTHTHKRKAITHRPPLRASRRSLS